MAKSSGLGWTTLTLDDASADPIDIRNDVTNFEFASPRAVQDVTGVDKSAMERLLLLADFSATLNGVFNATVSHAVLKTVATSAIDRTLALGVASQTLSVECKVTDYALKRAEDGALTWEAPMVLANGTAPAWS